MREDQLPGKKCIEIVFMSSIHQAKNKKTLRNQNVNQKLTHEGGTW